jgi:hypothetical protein
MIATMVSHHLIFCRMLDIFGALLRMNENSCENKRTVKGRHFEVFDIFGLIGSDRTPTLDRSPHFRRDRLTVNVVSCGAAVISNLGTSGSSLSAASSLSHGLIGIT